MGPNPFEEREYHEHIFRTDATDSIAPGWSKRLMPPYILVVDDDPDAQEVLVDVIQGLDLEARSAWDGDEALAVVQQEVPGLILLDLMMPNLDGFGFYSRLRAVRETRYIPVIVVTACEREQVDMLRLPGVMEVVQKGQFSIGDLGALISDTLRLAGSKRGSAGVRPTN